MNWGCQRDGVGLVLPAAATASCRKTSRQSVVTGTAGLAEPQPGAGGCLLVTGFLVCSRLQMFVFLLSGSPVLSYLDLSSCF